MKFKNLNDMILRNQDGMGGGGAGAGDAGSANVAGAAGAAGSQAANSGQAAPGGQGAPNGAQGQGDNGQGTPGGQGAEGGQGTPSAPQPYFPEGLADQFKGANERETLDKMAKALQGYRERDSQRQVPEKADAYQTFPDTLPETVKPHIETLKGDPLFDRISAKALDLRMPVNDFQALTTEMFSVAAEMGLMEPPINAEAERAALTPDAAKHLPAEAQRQAREQRMNDNFAFLDKMADSPEKRGLSKDNIDFVKAMLGDSAKGHQFIEHIKSMTGGASGPVFNGQANNGADPKQDLQRRAALPENTWGHAKFNQASYDAYITDMKRIHGN